VEEPEVGKVYKGTVRRIVDFGAFVEILPNTEALLHVSEIAHTRTERVEDVLKEGDEIEVKVLSMERDGKIRLSRRALLPVPEGMEPRPEGGGGGFGGGGRGDRGDRGDRGGRGGGRDRGGRGGGRDRGPR
jgi:polyribonucleotide nucleotidyltransferase